MIYGIATSLLIVHIILFTRILILNIDANHFKEMCSLQIKGIELHETWHKIDAKIHRNLEEQITNLQKLDNGGES